jgi:pyridoxamine 5'-phosphate oxidase
MNDPMALFGEWLSRARVGSPLRHPSAMCVSTVDREGVPDARFVDLKEVRPEGFVFCTRFDSRKGKALDANSHIALTFWWDHIERQVRVSGKAERVSTIDADRFFAGRPRDAQLASWASDQSASLDDVGLLDGRLRAVTERFDGAPIPRPDSWGGYLVIAARIEFLTFKANRMHERLVFHRDAAGWRQQWLQP